MYDVLDWLVWGRQSRAWQRWIYGKEKQVIRGKHYMHHCRICTEVFGPKEVNGVQELQTFKGYTVDFRLQAFRKIPREMPPEFIEFDSVEGIMLAEAMHEAATKQLNKQFAKLA